MNRLAWLAGSLCAAGLLTGHALAGKLDTALLGSLNGVRMHGAACPSGPRAPAAALRWNEQLASAARQQASYLAGSGRVTHSGPDGSTPRVRAASFGVAAVSVTEIVYLGAGPDLTRAMNWWKQSAVHCFYMTDARYAQAGASVVTGPRGSALVIVMSSLR